MTARLHDPVMLTEVLDALAPRDGFLPRRARAIPATPSSVASSRPAAGGRAGTCGTDSASASSGQYPGHTAFGVAEMATLGPGVVGTPADPPNPPYTGLPALLCSVPLVALKPPVRFW